MRTFYLTRTDAGHVTTSLVDYDELTGNWTESSGSVPSVPQTSQEVTITKQHYASNDTNVSVDETFNQLILTCDLEELDTLVESPTDEEHIYSPYRNRQRYATEYVAWGEGNSAINGWGDMITTGSTQYDGALITDHYVQLYKSNVWRFSGDEYMRSDHKGQLDFFKTAKQKSCMAFLMEAGKTTGKKATDNSVDSKIDMSRYLCITINGNGKNEENQEYPTSSVIEAAAPVATYIGNINGGFFSPADDATTNYLVLSGKMTAVCQGLRNSGRPEYMSGGWKDMVSLWKESDWMTRIMWFWHDTLHLDDDKNGDGAYYACKFYDATYDTDEPVARTNSNENSLFPWNSEWKSMTKLKYTYSAYGEEIDKISKFPLLQVTIKIGEKYACEMIDANGKSYYEWHSLQTCPVEYYKGEKYYRNHIYIGADIAIDDFIIGKEYDFSNSVQPSWNVEAEGIAIPIHKSDGLSGKVEMTIDGPVKSRWEQICRKHPTFFRSTSWWTDTYDVLANISHIMLKDFKVEIYSDNALINNIPGDKDLIYQTEELTDYVEKKDDIEFAIATALTTAECEEKGIKNTVLKNNPYVGENPLRSITNTVTNFTGKPEEQYLNDYWPLYNQPKQIVETTVHMPAGAGWNSKFRVSTFNYQYYPMNDVHDVKMDKHTVTIRQL